MHYENPRPAVTVVAVQNGNILLVQRAVAPALGEWCLPGGFMELRESAAEAARRELKEETDLSATNLSLLGICPFPGGIEQDLLVLGFVAEGINGTIKPGDDALDAQYFPFHDHPRVAFRCHREIIRQYQNRGEEFPVDTLVSDVQKPG
ncbi:NUDIX domain-containing protein [Candidatus Neomarinimicrobiota bacterium]